MTPKKRGGSRPNAGRKPTGPTRRKISVTISPEADENIRAVAKRGKTTVSALADAMFRRAN